ncbi:MAG: 2Fe-2S iron-sulfur cluster-binding protein [Rhizobacter sp.]|nr:2Fe-2S iron-sulfur cluster-binding protein [Rhizobacter sp.]
MTVRINARNRAHAFDASAGESILYAGLRQGLSLPYECASGTCGTCKARLLSGEIENHWPQAPGGKLLKAADEFLMCQCSARGEVSVEVTAFVHETPAGTFVPRPLGAKIAAATMLAPDVLQLDVQLERGLEFDAGQFVLVRVPGIDGWRGWSMVNYARNPQTLRFVVKNKPGGGLSDWLFSAPRAGSTVEVFGPLGSATFHPSLGKDIVCIAGGSGIAGMMSILARAEQDGYFVHHSGDVFFGVRTLRDAFYLDEFTRLRQRCGERLRVTIALSDEAAAPNAAHPLLAFETGLVHEVAQRALNGRLEGVRAYLAGPPPAVDASVRMLLMARVSTANIRYDKFS